MSPLTSLSVLLFLSLCMGALLSPDAPTCSRPPCRDSLVAAPLMRAGGCEERSATGGCRLSGPKPPASEPPTRGEERQEVRQGQSEVGEVSERLAQLQRCMGGLQEPGGHRGQAGGSLGATLALMAAVLTECDLHCHSQALRSMAKRLEAAAVGREGEKDLLILLRSITLHPPTVAPSARLYPQDCAEIQRMGIKENGIYTIQPDPHRPALEAACDMVTAGGGWTVFQRRRDGSVDFNRTWQEYREGFGAPQGEHWLGNAALHGLTAVGQHQLRVQLEDWHQQRRQATYSTFRVASEANRYRLTARDYSGDAGNALSYSKRYNHDGRAFSTADRDHDRYVSGNCAQYYGAGWWFDSCLAANLNGKYYRGRYSGLTNGIYWGTWYILTDARSGERYSFKTVEMKTRPRDF
ncbi:fibroleukin [Megalops cyprinoides]|uniref:fibroleukin n=1 Tax=Megalops cyprinoides TaxID=118141 RepID=UPI001864144F|nr:fibroleukin [Megalops cyprinoides]